MLGHFAPLRWSRGQDQVHELFVGGEGLARGAAGVLATPLHEAAHGIASTRGIQHTSRQGRYHNARSQAIAREVGIEVLAIERGALRATTVNVAGDRSRSPSGQAQSPFPTSTIRELNLHGSRQSSSSRRI